MAGEVDEHNGESVTHYADDSDGVVFEDALTIAPLPSLCRSGTDGDLMTWFPDDVTCPRCLNLFAGVE